MRPAFTLGLTIACGCTSVGTSSAQEPEVRIELNSHSGDESEGTLLALKGDGTVTVRSIDENCLEESGRVVTETLRLPLPRETVEELAKGFDQPEIRQQAREPRLRVEPKEEWPKRMRYLASVTGRDPAVQFEVAWFDPSSDRLTIPERFVARIQESARAQAEAVRKADAAFLTQEKMTELLSRQGAVTLTMDDIQGLWGGHRIRIDPEGAVSVLRVRPPKAGESGTQRSRHTGRIDATRARDLVQRCVEGGVLEAAMKRPGVPDERIVRFTLQARVDGVTYTRRGELWAGEAEKSAEFKRSWDAMVALAQDMSPYPNELEGYKFFRTARWSSLTPLVSTMADVRKTLGEPAEAKDIARYGEPYPGDGAAKQPIFLYAVDDDWEMIVYFVKSDLSDPKELRARVPDTLYQIALIPKRAISFKEVVFPAAFQKRNVTAADASWDAYGDGSGLVYQVYTCRTMHGKREPGDLNRINYGPAEEAVRKIVESADK